MNVEGLFSNLAPVEFHTKWILIMGRPGVPNPPTHHWPWCVQHTLGENESRKNSVAQNHSYSLLSNRTSGTFSNQMGTWLKFNLICPHWFVCTRSSVSNKAGQSNFLRQTDRIPSLSRNKRTSSKSPQGMGWDGTACQDPRWDVGREGTRFWQSHSVS